MHTLLVRFFGTANFGTLNANIGTCQFQYIINISQSTSDVKTGFFPNWLLVTQKQFFYPLSKGVIILMWQHSLTEKNSSSVPICFFWVSTRVPLCCTVTYPMWRNSVGPLLPCMSRFYMPQRDPFVDSFSPVKSALVLTHMVNCRNLWPSWLLFFEPFPDSRHACTNTVTSVCSHCTFRDIGLSAAWRIILTACQVPDVQWAEIYVGNKRTQDRSV